MIDPTEKLVFAYLAIKGILVFEAADDRLPMSDFAKPVVLTIGAPVQLVGSIAIVAKFPDGFGGKLAKQ
ncbi:MAG: hypothetical protein NZ772_02420 [Cyanobacteria bacterium]|nr:hypothetical protein [Cyanobacteriota bacterium]MDW8199693.1 hypothetical protein [Cyanobacteriota bacterium SKYGB_h_bin112]